MFTLKRINPVSIRPCIQFISRTCASSIAHEKKLTPEITNKSNLTKYLTGYQRFHNHYFKENPEIYNKLQNSQHPSSIIIGCSDSRVDPAIITDAKPGDLFVVRNVANLVGPYINDGGHHGTATAIEYAVKVLKVKNIIVLGHSKCGGIQGLMDGNASQFDFVGDWMNIAQNAKTITLEEHPDAPREVQLRACEHNSILESLKNLLTYPWIVERLEDKSLSISGWYFDFDQGELLVYDGELEQFVGVKTPK